MKIPRCTWPNWKEKDPDFVPAACIKPCFVTQSEFNDLLRD